MARTQSSISIPSFVLAVAAALGCGSAEDTTLLAAPAAELPAPAEPAEPEAPAPAEPAPSDEALMVMNRVCSPEGCKHYMYFMRELPADGVLDQAQGIELGDTQAAIFDGVPYVFDRLNQTVTRWSVDENLVARPEQSVSFQATGMTQLDAIANVFVSPTRAFVLDSKAGVLATWNPRDMLLVATTPVPDSILRREGAALTGYWPISSGGQVYYSASWYDSESNTGYGKAALLAFPSDVDQPQLRVLEDDRCGITAAVAPFADERGDVYFAGDWYIGLEQIGLPTRAAPTPACMLRVRAGSETVDPDYYVDLLRAADARALTAAFYLGQSRWLLNVWPNAQPALTRAELEADPYAYFGARNFEYVVIVDLAAGTRIPVSGLSRGSYGGLTPMYMDGMPLVQVFPENSAETGALLYQVSPEGVARRVLQAGPSGDFELLGRLR